MSAQIKLDRVIRELEGMEDRLKSADPPGSVGYISKKGAAEWTARLIGDLREAREICGAAIHEDAIEETDLVVRDLYLSDPDIRILREYLQAKSYDVSVCVSVLLSRGINAWAADRKQLAEVAAVEHHHGGTESTEKS